VVGTSSAVLLVDREEATATELARSNVPAFFGGVDFDENGDLYWTNSHGEVLVFTGFGS
jgi:hypothetical protein